MFNEINLFNIDSGVSLYFFNQTINHGAVQTCLIPLCQIYSKTELLDETYMYLGIIRYH